MQADKRPFNKGMLFNIGFVESMKNYPWDCVILHDIDHLPEHDHNFYSCLELPRHMAVMVDRTIYQLLQETYSGGVHSVASL